MIFVSFLKFERNHRADLTQISAAGRACRALPASFAGMMLLLLTRAGVLMLFVFWAGAGAEITHRINRKDIFSSCSLLLAGNLYFKVLQSSQKIYTALKVSLELEELSCSGASTPVLDLF